MCRCIRAHRIASWQSERPGAVQRGAKRTAAYRISIYIYIYVRGRMYGRDVRARACTRVAHRPENVKCKVQADTRACATRKSARLRFTGHACVARSRFVRETNDSRSQRR